MTETHWKTVWDVLAGVVLLLCGIFLNRIFEKTSRLVYYVVHVSAFRLKPPGGALVNVFSHSTILRNVGKSVATNVQIMHRNLPDFNIYPAVPHTVETLADGGRMIVIPRMVPREEITISYLYFPPLLASDINGDIKSDQGFAEKIAVLLQVKASKKMIVTVWSLIILGIFALLYLAAMLFRVFNP